MNTLMNVPKNGGLAQTNSDRQTNYTGLSSWVDDFFNREFPSLFSPGSYSNMSLPQVNIKETADEYFVEMAVPGMKKSDFQIELDNHLLSISTEREEETEETKENYTRREFGYSSFKRSFTLPETVDAEKIKASYNDGILGIHLPKKEEAKQRPPKTIKIS
ncbi:MAG: Hsp20/alpha crystallin family protein [Aequorivita sp.]